MNRIRKMILMLFAALLLLASNSLFVSASGFDTIPILEAIDLPQDLDFTVSSVCSGHAYFMQAAADPSGCCAVYSRHVDPDDYSKVDFQKVYIDIYQSDGSFLQELTFKTPFDLAFELEGKYVNIYFYKSVLVYDLTTQELFHYAIPDGAAVNGGLYKQLRSKEFTAGNWVYRCKKGFGGYVKLTRSDGEQVQVLVEMPGTGDLWTRMILPSGAIGIVIMIIAWQVIKKQNRKKIWPQKDDDSC